MKIAKLLSVALIVVFAVGLIGCKKPPAKENGRATTQPADTGGGGTATTQPADTGGGAGATTQPAATTQPVATVATVNAKCPMMGGKFDKAKVATDLVREFAGQKVGFCSAKCLPKWDELSDVEKTAKLATAMAPAP